MTRPQPARSTDLDGARQAGTIKRLVKDKGFGFVAGVDGKEYFFHRSAAQPAFESLGEGDAVTFIPATGPKGPRTDSVQAV